MNASVFRITRLNTFRTALVYRVGTDYGVKEGRIKSDDTSLGLNSLDNGGIMKSNSGVSKGVHHLCPRVCQSRGPRGGREDFRYLDHVS